MKITNKLLMFIFLLFIYFSIPVANAAWQAPAGNPYTGNDTFHYIINSEGINDYYILNKPFGLDNAFSVNTNALYIDEINNRTGIATNNPQVTLDVWGTVKFFNTNTLPTCDSSVSGAIIFNTNQDRLNVCINSAWRRIGYDGDLDHYLDYADCNDNDPSVAVEICGDKISNDCDSDINEGCVCGVNDWTSLTCPDMSDCDNEVFLYPTKLTDCIGTPPTITCPCVCRVEHFYAPVPPVCPVCRANNTNVYSTKITGITCTDSNNVGTTSCADNCTGYCSGDICCNKTPYYTCEGKNRVHYDACGVKDSSEYCVYGCEGGSCKEDPCAIITSEAECLSCGGNWDEWYIDEFNKGALCITAH